MFTRGSGTSSFKFSSGEESEVKMKGQYSTDLQCLSACETAMKSDPWIDGVTVSAGGSLDCFCERKMTKVNVNQGNTWGRTELLFSFVNL